MLMKRSYPKCKNKSAGIKRNWIKCVTNRTCTSGGRTACRSIGRTMIMIGLCAYGVLQPADNRTTSKQEHKDRNISPPFETPTWNEVWPAFSTAKTPPLLATPVQLPNPALNTISNTFGPPPWPGIPTEVSFVTKNRGGDCEFPEHNATDMARTSDDGNEKAGGFGRDWGLKDDRAFNDSIGFAWAATKAACSRHNRAWGSIQLIEGCGSFEISDCHFGWRSLFSAVPRAVIRDEPSPYAIYHKQLIALICDLCKVDDIKTRHVFM